LSLWSAPIVQTNAAQMKDRLYGQLIFTAGQNGVPASHLPQSLAIGLEMLLETEMRLIAHGSRKEVQKR